MKKKATRGGLVRKSITVRRKGRTIHQMRMVRSESAPEHETPATWHDFAKVAAGVALVGGAAYAAHVGGQHLAAHGRASVESQVNNIRAHLAHQAGTGPAPRQATTLADVGNAIASGINHVRGVSNSPEYSTAGNHSGQMAAVLHPPTSAAHHGIAEGPRTAEHARRASVMSDNSQAFATEFALDRTLGRSSRRG